MKSVQGSHVTVNEICEYFKNQGISMGTTTVYRHLEKMVREGVVAKYVVDGTSSACFEYTGEKKQDSQPVCYHCKCEKCGKLIHLQCEEVESLKQHMMEHHNFEMDALRTVFYGICSECRKNESYKDNHMVACMRVPDKRMREKRKCRFGSRTGRKCAGRLSGRNGTGAK